MTQNFKEKISTALNRSRKSDICLSSTLFKMKTEVRVLSHRQVIGQCGEYALRIRVPQLKDILDFEIKRDLALKIGHYNSGTVFIVQMLDQSCRTIAWIQGSFRNVLAA